MIGRWVVAFSPATSHEVNERSGGFSINREFPHRTMTTDAEYYHQYKRLKAARQSPVNPKCPGGGTMLATIAQVRQAARLLTPRLFTSHSRFSRLLSQIGWRTRETVVTPFLPMPVADFIPGCLAHPRHRSALCAGTFVRAALPVCGVPLRCAGAVLPEPSAPVKMRQTRLFRWYKKT